MASNLFRIVLAAIVVSMLNVFVSGSHYFSEEGTRPWPLSNCSLSEQTDSSVEVMCVEGYDGGLQQHFLLELYSGTSDTPSPRYTQTSENQSYVYFSLDNLEPRGTNVIVLYAVNAKGRSEPVVLQVANFGDAEKGAASDEKLHFWQILGVLIVVITTIAILLVIIRVRKSRRQPEAAMEQKIV